MPSDIHKALLQIGCWKKFFPKGGPMKAKSSEVKNIPQFRSDKEREFCREKWVLLYGFHDTRVILDTEGNLLSNKELDSIYKKAQKMGILEPVGIFCTSKKFLFCMNNV